MDFSLTKEQQMFVASVEEFAKKEVAPTVDEREEKGEFSREIWKKMADFGLLGLCIPEEYGGEGADAMTTVLAMQAFVRASGDGSLALVWGAHLLIGAMPIAELGTEEQKQKYLPKMAKGELIGAFALTEPDAGSDATALQTTADKKDDHYILNGSKTYISNAPIADVVITFATLDPALKAGGITIFIVEKDSPGYVAGPPLKKYAADAAPTGEIFFDNCKVPAENLLGKEGEGFTALLLSLGWERLGFTPAIGIMEAGLEQCLDYARKRKQFGKPIAKFQLVQAMLAEIKIDIEASKWLAYHLAWMMDNKQFTGLDAAIAKTFITEAGERIARKSIQIFGGYGCMKECPVGRGLWAAKMGTIGGGTSEIQRIVIGNLLAGI